jgi:formate dehydrogenase maturation protein FdhE
MEVMNAYASLMLMVIVLVALFLSWRRTNQRLPEEIREQAICPHCGRITPSAQVACLECGGVLTL